MEGNQMKMREALENSNGLLEELAAIGEWGESAREQIAENNAALSAPARQCDVGTQEEQEARMIRWCGQHNCKECPFFCVANDGVSCEFTWAQSSYESDKKGDGDGM